MDKMVGYCYVAVASLAITRTLASTVTVQPGDYNDGRVLVDFGEEADITSQTWHLHGDETTQVNDWAIRLDTNSDFRFSSWISTMDFVVSGQKVTNAADMFLGFGDGSHYFTIGMDFDGKFTSGKSAGVHVYPSCGGSLAVGDVKNVLSGSSQYHDNAHSAVRDALAGGKRANWHQLGGQRYDNGDTWPVTIEIENNLIADQATVKFVTQTVQQECVFNGAFAIDTDLTFGVMPDMQTGIDEINIDFITVAKAEVDICDGHCEASGYAPMMDLNRPVDGSWTVELSAKDMLIAALCVVNVVVLIAVICSCSRFGGAGPQRKKYEVVSVNGDSEMEQFRN